MLLEGTVHNGSIVLDEFCTLPDGAWVEVILKSEPKSTVGDRLLALAGLIDDGPDDLADQHDHYLHGTPKR